MHGIRDTVSRQSGRTQKHDCPFCPLALPSLSGTGHQPVSVSTEGHLPATWQGTGPFHGAMSLSIALRGGGLTTCEQRARSGNSDEGTGREGRLF